MYSCVVIKENSILLLTSRLEQDKWVLPKGGWENDESELEAAQRETFEEAGVFILNNDDIRLKEIL